MPEISLFYKKLKSEAIFLETETVKPQLYSKKSDENYKVLLLILKEKQGKATLSAVKEDEGWGTGSVIGCSKRVKWMEGLPKKLMI